MNKYITFEQSFITEDIDVESYWYEDGRRKLILYYWLLTDVY